MEDVSDIQTVTNINSVPAEVLFLIFSLLPPKSLRAVVLMCRRWREVGEHPSLWTFVTLMANHRDLVRLPLMLGSRRFQAVRKLYLGELEEEVLEAQTSRTERTQYELSADVWLPSRGSAA